MAQSEAVKLKKLELKAQREAQMMLIARQLIASPLVQLVGSVAIAEGLEKAGVLSARWAGALEGGVVAMVALQAYKDMGLVGLGAIGGGMGAGELMGSLEGSAWDKLKTIATWAPGRELMKLI